MRKRRLSDPVLHSQLLGVAGLFLGLAMVAACHPLPLPGPPLRIPPPPIKELRLDNGLRIFVVPRRTSPTFAAAYSFDVGAADDPRGKSGIAHLLEHMMFTGSRELGALDPEREAALADRLDVLWRTRDGERDPRRPAASPAEPTAKEQQAKFELLSKEIDATTKEYRSVIARDEHDLLLDRMGAQGSNAMTGSDYTSYVVQLPANRLELWFRLESYRLMKPVFRDFYAERDVVREERRRNTDARPERLVWEALSAVMFSAHPYGTPTIGWPGDIEHLHRDDSREFFRAHYAPAHCALVLVGDVQVDEVVRLAQK